MIPFIILMVGFLIIWVLVVISGLIAIMRAIMSQNSKIYELLAGHKAPPSDAMPKNLFREGDRVQHKNGQIYEILGTCTIERSLTPAYLYAANDETAWVRPMVEMEDGRFTAISEVSA